ncbi:YpmS family protein [Streptococcus merionis]|uniref:Membrane protein n=1 Tax=Streptococcus merionis TaxID=400065 RepID=A0A239STQ3_9STRE|nr:YpmS family protein [Streptococcus merionis]SNU88787.1 membrane protein [Streptococcus merionis]
MKRVRFGNKINIWKWLFIGLVGVQLALMTVLFLRMSSPRETDRTAQEVTTNFQVGTFSTTRDQLNLALKSYLKNYQSKTFTYAIYLTEKRVVFEGFYEILGAKIPLYVYFSPYRDETGAVILEVNEVSAGTLSLPKSEILNYISKNYKLPKAILIDPKTGKITVDLPHIENKLGMAVKARSIDLYNDQLIFEVFQK